MQHGSSRFLCCPHAACSEPGDAARGTRPGLEETALVPKVHTSGLCRNPEQCQELPRMDSLCCSTLHSSPRSCSPLPKQGVLDRWPWPVLPLHLRTSGELQNSADLAAPLLYHKAGCVGRAPSIVSSSWIVDGPPGSPQLI